MLVVLLAFALAMSAPGSAISATKSYSLQTSWSAPDVAYIVSDGSTIWALNTTGTHVTHYGGTGDVVGGWNTNAPSGTFALGRGVGVDANGFVYVLTSTQETGGLLQKFTSDGTLVTSSPSPVPYNLGFAVGSDGTIYGGDDTDDATELVAVASDGAQYLRILPCCHAPLFARSASTNMIPTGAGCGGRSNTQSNCFNVISAVATPSTLIVSAYWCNASAECSFETHVYGPGPQLLGTIPSSARQGAAAAGGMTVDSQNALYIQTGSGTIEKWITSGSTPTKGSTWGAVKSIWR